LLWLLFVFVGVGIGVLVLVLVLLFFRLIVVEAPTRGFWKASSSRKLGIRALHKC
jgi:high-affinity Fe2+/Pb2+ permease